jgi:hypothetical protein
VLTLIDVTSARALHATYLGCLASVQDAQAHDAIAGIVLLSGAL